MLSSFVQVIRDTWAGKVREAERVMCMTRAMKSFEEDGPAGLLQE